MRCESFGAQRDSGSKAWRSGLGLLAACLLLGAACERTVSTVQVGGTFTAPIFLTAPAGDARLFVVERAGVVRVLDENQNVLAAPFLDLRGRVGTSGEGGLLGMAFSPTYATDGLFYVYYVDTALDSVLARFRVDPADPDRADAASEYRLLVVDQPAAYTNHRGGTIAFSPADGYLYWALGDGGGSNDPDNRAQDPTTLLGKMLRLDVAGGLTTPYRIPPGNPYVGPDGVRDEIWSSGFRNPFRFSFDRASGNLWIGDVGQGAREEIDLEPAGTPGGRNYGWKVHEGTRCNLPQPGLPCEAPASPSRFTFPVYEYATRAGGTCAVTGGVVYRGSVPFLRGTYLFADFCSDRIWGILDGTLSDLTTQLRPLTGTIDGVVAFGEDGFGEVYVVSLGSGQVHRIQ